MLRVKELRGRLAQAETWEELLPMIEDAKQGRLESALEYDHSGEFAS